VREGEAGGDRESWPLPISIGRVGHMVAMVEHVLVHEGRVDLSVNRWQAGISPTWMLLSRYSKHI
jgi:hypothetical protein